MSGLVSVRVKRRKRSRLVLAVWLAAALVGSSALIPAARAASNPDPWEPMNRGTFWFNEKVDMWALAPVAQAWRFATPSLLRTAVTNFNDNLQMPVVFGNNVFQLKPANAGYDFLRVLFNSTLGLAGFIDLATMVDIPQNDEDFGQTLGYWGVPTGPYFVIPFFGPSNVRDTAGTLGDTASTFYFSFLPFWSTLFVRGLDIVNVRSLYLEEIDENRRESFDYYVFMRNAYLQSRRSKVEGSLGEAGGNGGGADVFEEDLYYFEEEEGE